MPDKPYSRGEFNRALILNALLDPFNVVLLAAVLVVGIVLGLTSVLAPAAVVLYLAGAARTYFDEDAANKVLAREKGEHRKDLETGRKQLDLRALDPQIARLVAAGREREARIRAAIAEADLPYEEVADEVDSFVTALEASARRAQLLASALADTPPEPVARRLAQVKDDPAQKELADALSTQLATLQRMEKQLARFESEMERILVELDTVRGQLVSVSASTNAAQGTELAGEVRSLRERMGAVADGMAEAYDATSE